MHPTNVCSSTHLVRAWAPHHFVHGCPSADSQIPYTWAPHQSIHGCVTSRHAAFEGLCLQQPSPAQGHPKGLQPAGDLHWSSSSREQQRQSSLEAKFAAGRSHHTHSPSLLHHLLLQRRSWDSGALPVAQTRQVETGNGGAWDAWLKIRLQKGEEKHLHQCSLHSSCFLLSQYPNEWSEVSVKWQ